MARTWRRKARGKYHAEGDRWLTTGKALCGRDVGVGSHVVEPTYRDAMGQLHRRNLGYGTCDDCARKVRDEAATR